MTTFHNRTRRAASIPRKLIREGKWYLLPLYGLLRTSELAREGIEHSGSYRFADHIYARKPKGRFGIGLALDAVLLRMKSARALRARYVYAKQEIWAVLDAHDPETGPLDLLAVPSGLAREFFEIADEMQRHAPGLLESVRFHGLDLDTDLVATLRARARDVPAAMVFRTGDALSPEAYPQRYDVILSTGLNEFLSDEDLVRFYRIVRSRLTPGGRFITSNLDRHPLSDYLLRNLGELHTHYRSEARLRQLAAEAGFDRIWTYPNADRLQTMLIATGDER